MDHLYWIWLQQALGCGSAVADAIVRRGIEPSTLYQADEEELAHYDFLSPTTVEKLKRTPISSAENILKICQKKKIWILTPPDADYPDRLRHIYQVPLVLYGVGDGSLLSKQLLITMVGSRTHSKNGARAAHDLAFDLVNYGFGIVSGLAMGIDSCCHQGALDAKGSTIGVAGCGLDVQYPTGNVELRRCIGRKGAIITEYPPGAEPKGSHFPVRNRILSGLSLGTVVVEAGAGSGVFRTVDHALEQGRDVFALPTDLYNPLGQGNLRLLAQGATLVLSPEDIVEEYSALYGDTMSKTIESRIALERNDDEPAVRVAAKREKKQESVVEVEEQAQVQTLLQPIPHDLEPSKRQLLQYLEGKTLRAEELALLCKMDMQETLVHLSELEIDGLVKAYPGKQFGR